MKFDNVYVLDTNIILNDANDIFTISQEGNNLVILPETVIDELDTKKTGFEEINFQARAFGRLLSDAEVIKTFKNGRDKNVTVMRIKIKENIIIDIISFKNYELDGIEKAILNDRKIIKVASFAKNFYKDSKVVLSLTFLQKSTVSPSWLTTLILGSFLKTKTNKPSVSTMPI